MIPKRLKLFGVVLMLASVWVGAYAMSIVPAWAVLPTYLTSAIGFCAGLGITVYAFGAFK